VYKAINTSTRLQQVKEYLISYITQNQLQRNDQLPSEAAIAKTLGVSRNTLREVYITLENEGIIVRRHGIGTFVANPPVIRDSLNEFSPFAQIIQEGGYTPNFQTLAMEFVAPDEEVCAVFRIPASEKIRCIKRLVLAGRQPVIYVDDYVAPVVEETALDWEAFDGNMVRFLANSLTTPLHQIQSSIRAALLDSATAQVLDLAEGSPILSVRSTIYSVDNKPVNFSRIYFNSNIVEFNIVRMIRAI
jgi:GntR family transcriptional regulator